MGKRLIAGVFELIGGHGHRCRRDVCYTPLVGEILVFDPQKFVNDRLLAKVFAKRSVLDQKEFGCNVRHALGPRVGWYLHKPELRQIQKFAIESGKVKMDLRFKRLKYVEPPIDTRYI